MSVLPNDSITPNANLDGLVAATRATLEKIAADVRAVDDRALVPALESRRPHGGP